MTSPFYTKIHILSILSLAAWRGPRQFPASTAVAVLAFLSSYLKVPNKAVVRITSLQAHPLSPLLSLSPLPCSFSPYPLLLILCTPLPSHFPPSTLVVVSAEQGSGWETMIKQTNRDFLNWLNLIGKGKGCCRTKSIIRPEISRFCRIKQLGVVQVWALAGALSCDLRQYILLSVVPLSTRRT